MTRPLSPFEELATADFAACWDVAGPHVGRCGATELKWLKLEPTLPLDEHFSFRLRNQIFIVRMEDVDDQAEMPGDERRLLALPRQPGVHLCRFPLHADESGWRPAAPGWGLVDMRTGHPVDPPSLVSDELIEMADWEVRSCAAQIVRMSLETAGRKVVTVGGVGMNDPHLWIEDASGWEWVVVRAARFPASDPRWPAECDALAAMPGLVGRGHFASVVLASEDDSFSPHLLAPTSLWRGRGMLPRYRGLVPVPARRPGQWRPWRSRQTGIM